VREALNCSPTKGDFMHKRAKDTIVGAVTGAVAIGALAAGLIVNAGADTARTATNASASRADTGMKNPDEQQPSTAAEGDAADGAAASNVTAPRNARKPAKKPQQGAGEKAEKTLPSGTSTGTSFWDPETASGRSMRYETIASPYWPLGTEVKITYKGRSIIGVVDDFGPAEWAVAQHSPPAIIDLSEKMMSDFTGVRQNSIPIKFQVLKWGKGRHYVDGGTGYDLAMGR
jgi:hypothetical protein